MGLFKPDPPTPPNPVALAGAQTGTNVSTAIANSMLNRTNQVTPQGSLSYSNTGEYSWRDPVSGETFNIPLQTATQTLTPQGQAIQAQNEGAQLNVAGMANALSGNIAQHLSNPLDLSDAPMPGQTAGLVNVPGAATSFEGGGPIRGELQGIGDITNTYGPEGDFGEDRQRVEEALYGRLNPQLERERGGIEQRLADQGIRYGSQAYASAMDDYNRQANDLRLGVTAQGGAEQQRLMQMEAQRAAFQNAAQQQGYEQTLGAGQFANAAQGQQFQQNALQGQFRNAALAQQLAQQQAIFNSSQVGRNQWLQEQYAARNQPIQEISALLSGSQVSQPNWINTPGAQIPTTDFAGLQNQNFQQQFGNYQQQANAMNQLVGGALGAAGRIGAGYAASDERVKKDIDRIGTVFAYDENKDQPRMGEVIGDRKELPIYEYSYKGTRDDGMRHTGPMAQDVEKIDRKAVKTIGGVKHIDKRRVMGNILRAA